MGNQAALPSARPSLVRVPPTTRAARRPGRALAPVPLRILGGARRDWGNGGGGKTEAISFVPCLSHESTPGGGVICKYTPKVLCFQKRGLKGNPLILFRCPSAGKGALGITLLHLTFPPAQTQGFPGTVWRIGGGGSKDSFSAVLSEGVGEAEQIPREEQPLPPP